MPKISEFYGIAILMFFHDHNPPHFHAKYSGQKALFSIENGEIIVGGLPPHAEKLVKEWYNFHKEELLFNWEAAKNGEELKTIPPLL